MLTSESVLSESCFLLARAGHDPHIVLELVKRNVVQVALRVEEEFDPLLRLLRRYRDVPMSLADATLVRLAEQQPFARVFTLDADFRRYRKNGRQTIPLVIPDDRT